MDITFTLIAQALVFALFIWFTAKFVWPPLMRAVETRQKQIADGLAAAEKGNRSLAEASAKTEEQLKAARSQAQEILAAASKQASQLVDQAKGTAQSEADRIKVAAREEVDREVNRARETLRKQVGELAVAGAAQILKREINAQAHADVLKDLAAKI
ncbi:MAG TPA: F0F1 ATP synthase subunit B [Verrucomicrobiae bacterium]|nr:F0F1 ATP synthase subunit B [Verrucomicrobiae bacterium]